VKLIFYALIISFFNYIINTINKLLFLSELYVSFTDRGTEYCDRAESHDYQLYLAINDIEHSKTKVRSPQANGICEHFHKTILQEFYQVTLRKLLYNDLESLQKDLDEWLIYYNNDPYTSR
jgi:transposase InsO family protein